MKKVLIASVLSVLLVCALVANEMINAPTAEASGGSNGSTPNAAVTTGKLSQFAATTSAEFFGVISDETGSTGVVVGSIAPAITGAATFNHSGVALASTSSGNVAIAATGQSSSSAMTATNSSTGPALTLTQTNGGYALVITPDTTSPARAPVLWLAQDAEPTGISSIGTMYVAANGALEVSSVGATPGTFQSVGNIGKLSTIAAAGTNQATATAMASGVDFVTVTGADGTKGVTLPTGAVARCVRVMTQVILETSTLLVFGHASDNDTVNGGAADASYAQKPGTSLVYCTANGTDWFSY